MKFKLRTFIKAKKKRKKELMIHRIRKSLRNRFMTAGFVTSVSKTKRPGRSITRLKNMKKLRSYGRLIKKHKKFRKYYQRE